MSFSTSRLMYGGASLASSYQLSGRTCVPRMPLSVENLNFQFSAEHHGDDHVECDQQNCIWHANLLSFNPWIRLPAPHTPLCPRTTLNLFSTYTPIWPPAALSPLFGLSIEVFRGGRTLPSHPALSSPMLDRYQPLLLLDLNSPLSLRSLNQIPLKWLDSTKPKRSSIRSIEKLLCSII